MWATGTANTRLQLGHAGEGVEIVIGAWRNRNADGLQLGHAGEGVEIVLVSSSVRADCLLQLGHAGEGVEISSQSLVGAGTVGSFNWATPVKAWRWDARTHQELRVWVASIGPRR